MSFQEAAGQWRDFYVTAGAAAATLVGLLFVGLSLHIRVVVAHADVRSLARVTLVNFFSVLLIALLVLAPAEGTGGAATWLLLVAVISLAFEVRPVIGALRGRRVRRLTLRLLIARFGLSTLAYAAVVASGALLARGQVASSLSALLAAVVLLLVVSVRNTWDLLVTVADRPPESR